MDKHILYETAKILIEKIKNAKEMEEIWLTYKDLSINLYRNAGINIKPRDTKNYIGELSIICYSIGLPLISCIVINSNDLKPGSGFFKLYGDLTGRKLKDEEWDIIWLEESKKCFQCKDWDKLLLEINPNHQVKFNTNNTNPNSSKRLEISERNNDDRLYNEGKERLKMHIKFEKERNSSVIKDAKAAFLKKHGRLYCQICGFDFEKVYGEIGKNFAEGHHKKMVADMDKEGETIAIDDIAIVCSNCHAMLHRCNPPITVEELKDIIEKNRGNF